MSFKIYTEEQFQEMLMNRTIDFDESFIVNPNTAGVFQSDRHRDNHLKYLFNRSSKYFNDRTKYNVYFEFETQEWLGENNRESLFSKYKTIYAKCNPKDCGYQRFDFNVGKDKKANLDTLKEVILELEKLDFFAKRESVKDLIYVFHGNQKDCFTHFHRLFHL